MFKPVREYRKWLTACAEYYGVTEEAVIQKFNRNPSVIGARRALFNICIRDNISIYEVAEDMGRNRTTGLNTIKDGRLRNKQAEQEIWDKIHSSQ